MNTKVLILIISLLVSNQFIYSQNNQDTLKIVNPDVSLLVEGNNSLEDIQSEYFVNAEIEHQKLLRNIFAIGFITLFIAVIYVFLYSGVFPNIVIDGIFNPHAI